MPTSDPYASTSVPVERSKEQIRRALKTAGAAAIQFEEEYGDQPVCRVRFKWVMRGDDIDPAAGAVPILTVRFEVRPLPPQRKLRGAGWLIDEDQRERQAWRGLVTYLESMLKAAAFGLLRFEEVFLAFVEDENGATLGDVVIPRLAASGRALPPGSG